MARVSDYDVERVLAWARNYGEIESFKMVRASGRKWLVRTAVETTESGAEPGLLTRAVPRELVFTSREAIAFGYGLSIAGARHGGRQAFAAREWGW